MRPGPRAHLRPMTQTVRQTLLPDGTFLFEAPGRDGAQVRVTVMSEAVDAVERAEGHTEHASHGEHTPARRLAIALRIAEPELRAGGVGG